MDFVDQIKALSGRIPKQIEVIRTEEATKNAFVMPFITALGYNVFDPTEVVPELIADIGVKKGEKVDYAILRDGKPIILFECKFHGANLDLEHASQLHRYFHVTPARIGVLTNGIVYRFFTDLEEPNKMDSKPFLEVNLLDLKELAIEDLKMFCKVSFVLDEILSNANELKYTREIQRLVSVEFSNPSEDFVKFFATKVYAGKKVTGKIREQFVDLTKRALHQFINDRINDRLKSAMSAEPGIPHPMPSVPIVAELAVPMLVSKEEKIVTTAEEMDAYLIIKAILRESVDPKRLTLRDTQSYAGILLDDNNRKPICRLRFTSAGKSLIFVNPDRSEEKFQIQDLNDIFGLSEKLRAALKSYELTEALPASVPNSP